MRVSGTDKKLLDTSWNEKEFGNALTSQDELALKKHHRTFHSVSGEVDLKSGMLLKHNLIWPWVTCTNFKRRFPSEIGFLSSSRPVSCQESIRALGFAACSTMKARNSREDTRAAIRRSDVRRFRNIRNPRGHSNYVSVFSGVGDLVSYSLADSCRKTGWFALDLKVD